MNILERLRAETREAHINLEQISGAGKIMDHTISLDEYIKVLKANYIAYAKVESQLSPLQNESIASWIAADLHLLNENLPEIHDNFKVENEMQRHGVMYVIEGSLLGGAMIAKHITECPKLKHLPQQQFYAPASPDRAKRWRGFTSHMSSLQLSDSQADQIVLAANGTFELFRQSFMGVDNV
ncbi:Heme oxygenase [Nonlabens sp. Hel1_33_55]|uniref:biliverdin-producing heme oxygenase n=1 Tax=Nonlabens sp. Hel1_33_55 TaxID=1336802 RepID=UPI000875AE09|nr:biliverdin-producing heme oxygenase [Nonlabens sp. Hel1_33_55]SCY35621.1 Heme oxygenase [Nonlabens sp. Hel1_33_55]